MTPASSNPVGQRQSALVCRKYLSIGCGLTLTCSAAYLSSTYTGAQLAKAGPQTARGKRLGPRDSRAVNPHPESPRFGGPAVSPDNPFFDPAERVQVRYDMVRRHEGGRPGDQRGGNNFGVSRTNLFIRRRRRWATARSGRFAPPPARPPKKRATTNPFCRDPDFFRLPISEQNTPEIQQCPQAGSTRIEVQFVGPEIQPDSKLGGVPLARKN